MIKLTTKNPAFTLAVPRRRNLQYTGQHTVRFWERSRSLGSEPIGQSFAGANIWVIG